MAILDARSRGAYQKSHIRGAIHADLFHYFVPGTDRKGLGEFRKDLARRLGNLGLTGKETIIAYESKLGMRAARVAWMLEYAGSRRVFLLEGGFRAWNRSGFPVEAKSRKPEVRNFRIRPASGVLATADRVAASKSDVILDVRSKGEFNGTEKRNCDERYGRIRGAESLEWTNFIDDANRFRNRSEMANILEEKGLAKNREIVTYCHRGARAAAAFYALRSLGFENVRNYIGSWHEWSARKELPVERGPRSRRREKARVVAKLR